MYVWVHQTDSVCVCVRLRMHRYVCIFVCVHFYQNVLVLKSEQNRLLFYPQAFLTQCLRVCVCVCVHLCMNKSVCIFVCVCVSAGLHIWAGGFCILMLSWQHTGRRCWSNHFCLHHLLLLCFCFGEDDDHTKLCQPHLCAISSFLLNHLVFVEIQSLPKLPLHEFMYHPNYRQLNSSKTSFLFSFLWFYAGTLLHQTSAPSPPLSHKSP